MKPPPVLRADTIPWLFLLLCGVAGCQTAPVLVRNPDTKGPPTVRLCGHEVPAERFAVQAEILRHVAPGLPVEAARTAMEELGFACLYGGFSDKKPAGYLPAPSLPELLGICARNASQTERFHSLVCTLSLNEIGNWSCFYPLTVTLPYDEQGRITQVQAAGLMPALSRHAAFFASRPGLREPIGLSVEQARAVMEAYRFHCAEACPEKRCDGRGPYLNCYAYDEDALGGRIVRVHLFYDPAGRVTEAELIQKVGEFDGLLCMVPNSSDTLAGGVVKAVVFPVRLAAVLMLAGLAAKIIL